MKLDDGTMRTIVRTPAHLAPGRPRTVNGNRSAARPRLLTDRPADGSSLAGQRRTRHRPARNGAERLDHRSDAWRDGSPAPPRAGPSAVSASCGRACRYSSDLGGRTGEPCSWLEREDHAAWLPRGTANGTQTDGKMIIRRFTGWSRRARLSTAARKAPIRHRIVRPACALVTNITRRRRTPDGALLAAPQAMPDLITRSAICNAAGPRRAPGARTAVTAADVPTDVVSALRQMQLRLRRLAAGHHAAVGLRRARGRIDLGWGTIFLKRSLRRGRKLRRRAVRRSRVVQDRLRRRARRRADGARPLGAASALSISTRRFSPWQGRLAAARSSRGSRPAATSSAVSMPHPPTASRSPSGSPRARRSARSRSPRSSPAPPPRRPIAPPGSLRSASVSVRPASRSSTARSRPTTCSSAPADRCS